MNAPNPAVNPNTAPNPATNPNQVEKQEDTAPPAPPAASVPVTEVLKFEPAERVPSDWEITLVEDDMIECVNIKTNKRVVTDRKSFSMALRGK